MTVVTRETRETRVRVAIGQLSDSPVIPSEARDPQSADTIDTSVPFLDHMLRTLARYSGLALSIRARGDLTHHVVEDVAICVGRALARHAPDTAARFGERTVAMDDALVQCVLDFGGRPYYRGPLPSPLYDHFLRSFADNAGLTLHLRVLRGNDRHHVVEAAFKALGLALRDALCEGDAVFSTKGAVRLEVSG